MPTLLKVAGLIIISAIFIAIAVVAVRHFQKKRRKRNAILTQELWEQLILRNPTEKELQNVIMAQKLLQEKVARKLLEIGQEKVSFLLVSIFGKSLSEEGWNRYLQYDETNILDLTWLITKATNPKVKTQSSRIVLAHCKELLTNEEYEKLSAFRDALKHIAKNIPSQKENAELFMVENKEEIIKKIRFVS